MKKFQFIFISILAFTLDFKIDINFDINIRPISRTMEYKGNFFI